MRDNTPNNGSSHQRITYKKSGHPVVDAVFQLEHDAKQDGGVLFGDFLCIPHIWSHIIVGRNGSAHHLAIRVMAEIWFRHKPIYGRLDDRGVVQLSKVFNGDRYQLNRSELANKFNVHPDTISEALNVLSDLGIIGRELRDKDINHRGFRNMSFVWPVPEKLAELAADAMEKLYPAEAEPEPSGGNCKQKIVVGPESSKTQQIPSGDLRERGGNSPACAGKSPPRGGNLPERGGKSPVFQEYSNKPSPSVVDSFSAEPKKNEPPEGNNINKSSASPQARPVNRDVVAPAALSLSSWSAPPPRKTGKDGRPGSAQEKAGIIRHYVGSFFQQWFQKEPDLRADEFEKLIVDHNSEVKLVFAQWVLTIAAGWLWAEDGPLPEAGKTFNPKWFSLHTNKKLEDLFKRTQKKQILYIAGLREEIMERAVNELDLDQDWNISEVSEWWRDQMEDRGVITDPDKYYREDGQVLKNVWKNTWAGLYRVLEDCYRWEKSEGKKPDDTWFQHACIRWKKEGPDRLHDDYYKRVGQVLGFYGHLSGPVKPERIDWK